MKSIETKIILIIGGLVAFFMVCTGIIMISFTKKTVISNESDIVALSAEKMTEEADSYFKQYITIAQQMSKDTSGINLLNTVTQRDQLKKSEYWQSVYDMLKKTTDGDDQILAAYYADRDTNIAFNGDNWVSDSNYRLNNRDYSFQTEEQLNRGYIITNPYVDLTTGANVITISAPMYDGSGTKLLGVAALDVELTTLTEKIEGFQLAHESGSVRLISGDGQILVSPHKEEVLKNINDIGLDTKIKSDYENPGEDVVYYREGKTLVCGITREIPSAGWKSVVTVDKDDFFRSSNLVVKTMTLLFAAIGVILIVVMYLVAKSIAKPLKRLTKLTNELASGNLNVDIDVKSNDEVGKLADSMRNLTGRLVNYITYIEEISGALDELGKGNLNLKLVQSYDGEFAVIKESLLRTSGMLKKTIGDLLIASEQVSGGSTEVANGSQALAQGTMEQAGVMEELSSTMDQISDKITETATNAKEAEDRAELVRVSADQSNEYMKQLLLAIEEIKNQSSEISKIIKTIEDITFQTNILALNAAVESARAGEAGKGFAVVADEVRNLANKSAQAAKNITGLIDQTIQAVENGTRLADDTSHILEEVVEGVKETAQNISRVSDAANIQAESLTQAMTGLEQVNSVVQSNSATAEESSAASEELSSQADMLKDLADKFRI